MQQLWPTYNSAKECGEAGLQLIQCPSPRLLKKRKYWPQKHARGRQSGPRALGSYGHGPALRWRADAESKARSPHELPLRQPASAKDAGSSDRDRWSQQRIGNLPVMERGAPFDELVAGKRQVQPASGQRNGRATVTSANGCRQRRLCGTHDPATRLPSDSECRQEHGHARVPAGMARSAGMS
jgi:hypothetical protein